MIAELDHQIARSKGWTHVPAGTPPWTPGKSETTPEGYRDPAGLLHLAPDCCWSTDDAKALELVDELLAMRAGEDPAWGFMCGFFGKQWNATFYRSFRLPDTGELAIRPGCHCEGEAPTRPEAISRAYLAAMAWMRGRG